MHYASVCCCGVRLAMARVRIFGELPKIGSVIVGAWDPLLPEVESRIRVLARKCQREGHARLVPVLLDPSPASLLNPNWHPRFECVEIRVAKMLEAGVTGVIRLSLSKHDLEQGIGFFLDAVTP